MEKFKELVSLCKGGLEIYINPHKAICQDVVMYTETDFVFSNSFVDHNIRTEMINMDSIIHITASTTPVGYYTVYHHDLEAAIDEALSLIKNDVPKHIV